MKEARCGLRPRTKSTKEASRKGLGKSCALKVLKNRVLGFFSVDQHGTLFFLSHFKMNDTAVQDPLNAGSEMRCPFPPCAYSNDGKALSKHLTRVHTEIVVKA